VRLVQDTNIMLDIVTDIYVLDFVGVSGISLTPVFRQMIVILLINLVIDILFFRFIL
jgi:hypothetical protein